MNSEMSPRHQRPIKSLDRFLFGAPYYPEHWTAKQRADDAKRMAEAGVNVVRMAEFAWHVIEPAREKYDWGLFDETIDSLAEHGIATMMCTPTATPPRWLTQDHPEWMRVDEQGNVMEHGTRQHCCTTAEGFRSESDRITRAMAEHYADNPNVIGWQTDNELYCHFSLCFCDACVEGFQAWLRERYGDIASVNRAWGTDFWALKFDDFSQVPLPYPNNRPAYPNPTHELDYYRFLSDAVTEFQRRQVEILREANPGWWIQHNGLFDVIDYWKFTEDLDFLAVDVYPGFGVRKPEDSVWPAVINERCRANSGGYIVPEQQGGAGGQKPYLHPTPAPGQMRLWAYQSIAHGADGMLHFRWRTCPYGAEEYWNGILDHDNIPRRRYEEFAREGRELKTIGEKILGTVVDVKAAALLDHDQDNAYKTLAMGLPSPADQRDQAYREMWNRHLPCGLVNANDRFDGLELIVLPSMQMMDEPLAVRLQQFVESGGTLMVTARSATKDRDNQVITQTPPGLIRELCGVTVEEFGKIESGSLSLKLGEQTLRSGGGYEVLQLCGAQEAGRWLAPSDAAPSAATDEPAVAINKVGRGTVIYVGTYLAEQNVSDLLGFALSFTTLTPMVDADQAVEVTRRTDGRRKLLFLLNHYPTPRAVRNVPAGTDLLTDQPVEGELELPAYGVAVVEEE